jgi:hypothetical protein
MNRLAGDGDRVNKPRLTRTRIALAFAVSVVADVLEFPINAGTATGIFAIPAEAIDLALDTVVMVIMSVLLGFHWSFLPSFLLETVPGLDLIPTWTGCVGFVVWQRRREDRAVGAP